MLKLNSSITRILWASALISCLCGAFLFYNVGQSSSREAQKSSFSVASSIDEGAEHAVPSNNTDRLHILLPASNAEVNLCKTMLTAAILGYPTPTLIAWNQSFDQGHLLGGGSHLAKISGVLEYLEAMDMSKDNDLVLMMDAYDIWFQLRPEVLINRYHKINERANERLLKRLGRAAKAEDLQQQIVFGAGKRCAPNQVHTVACYPIPESPLPGDLYGPNTDTIMGRNKYTSLRQRYLNSGFIIGPAGLMRKMFRRAWEKAQAIKDQIEWDNGSHGSDFTYHGSDQSIFNIMLGEQEFQREVLRRRYRATSDSFRGIALSPKITHIEGTLVDDPLSPSFTHEPFVAEPGKSYEFGMGLDYFSELGQQTVNAEDDARWIQHNRDLKEQVANRGIFDCASRVTGQLPKDILESRRPYALDGNVESESSVGWDEVPLYTNLCLDSIPVMIHHNGDKGAREYAWDKLWLQPDSRRLVAEAFSMDEQDTSADGQDAGVPVGEGRRQGGAFSDSTLLTWNELCPTSMDAELYRDV